MNLANSLYPHQDAMDAHHRLFRLPSHVHELLKPKNPIDQLVESSPLSMVKGIHEVLENLSDTPKSAYQIALRIQLSEGMTRKALFELCKSGIAKNLSPPGATFKYVRA